MEQTNKYVAMFEDELARMVRVEAILKKYGVKCHDWIGLVSELTERPAETDEVR